MKISNKKVKVSGKKRVLAVLMSFLMIIVPYYWGNIYGIRNHPFISIFLIIGTLMLATIRSSLFIW